MGAAGSTQVSEATKSLVAQANATHKVVVYSKSYCPHCRATKQLLQHKNAFFHLYELDQRSDGYDIQEYIGQTFGHDTVPAIFINNKLVGGNSDLQALDRAGRLDTLLRGP
ncbi:glutaredoxin [Kappamyces sp. JEL0829]|nr:glutaredoxin [Kappamyces sp. JEL0829]